jgi:beta-lactamase regulating signal transducer with metallopeptidase domain
MVVVLAGAWLAVKLDRSRTAATRYRVWLIAIIISAALPVLDAICASLPGPVVPPPLPITSIAGVLPAYTTDAPMYRLTWTSLAWPILSGLWVGGALAQLARLGGSYWKLRRIKREGQTQIDSGAAIDVYCQEADARPFVGRRPVPIIWSTAIKSPGLAGLFRPAILLPADMASWTSSEERVSILRHELAHIKRRDHLVSLLQSVLSAVFFFHPPLRYVSNQLSLERELACDDTVLGLGTEPRAYAESILKAAERTFITDVIHQPASFAAKRKLERRIDMILDPNRLPQPSRQGRFLLLPLMLMGIITWLVMPAASGRPRVTDAPSEPGAGLSATSGLSNSGSQSEPIVGRQTIWTDTVKRGPLVMQVRALGNLRQESDGRFLADLKVPEVMIRRVEVGLPASVDTRMGVVPGRVFRIHGRARDGVVRVDITVEGELPAGAGSGLPVDGMIEVGRLDDVIYVGRPVHGVEDSTASLFKLADDGTSAARVRVRFGRASANAIQILDGLKPGDKVILSDMSAYDNYDRITLK